MNTPQQVAGIIILIVDELNVMRGRAQGVGIDEKKAPMMSAQRIFALGENIKGTDNLFPTGNLGLRIHLFDPLVK